MLSTLIAFAAIAVQQQQAPTISDAEKREVIASLLKNLEESYVFPDLARQAAEKVNKLLKEGEYRDINEPSAFVNKLSADVKEVLKDAHFRMRYSVEKLPERADAREPSQAEIDAMKRQTTRLNAGFQKLERLPGNIGYLEVTGFMDPGLFAAPCAAAFDFLASTDALILDLRRNGGGDPESVRILCSYLFSETPVHLNSLYFRKNDETIEFWTLKDLPGKRYLDKPVYVLTSKRTGSGAEECTYNLLTQKRSTTIGESTWGGANPGGTVRLTDHVQAFIPVGRAINPVTHTNWEGTGVKPDVECPAEQALEKAQVMAIEELMKSADPEWKQALQTRLDELKGAKEKVLYLLRGVSDM